MTAVAPGALIRWRLAIDWSRAMGGLTSVLLLTLVGVELAVLAAVLPETLEMWWRADRPGDFANFFRAANDLDLNGLYSPALSLLMHPLTYLGPAMAYRLYVGLGGLAVLAVAYFAQRGVHSPEARIAVALGIISIPQMHWALRLGHLTPFLALAALGGFMLLRRRPYLAGLCFVFLVLKPQYAPIPLLYLLWTRNGRALAAFVAGALALELAGFGATGFGGVGAYLGSFFDLSSDVRDNLMPYQLAWQYAWQGFLISAGIEPNPLVALDLSLLSLGVVVLVWVRSRPAVALAAAALGMLLVTPYANFYDWGLLVVFAALLLRAGGPWSRLHPAMLLGLYFAMLVSQGATPWPAVDVELGAVGTGGHFFITPSDLVFPAKGIYWITPAALAVVALLALVGGKDQDEDERASTQGALSGGAGPGLAGGLNEARTRVRGVFPQAGWFAAAALLIPLAYFVAAFVGDAPPFTKTYDPFSRSEIVKQLPPDFPLPSDRKLEVAEQGSPLPYHVEWTTPDLVSDVAPIYRRLLAEPAWELMLHEESSPSYRIRLAHFTQYGFMTHWAMLDVSPQQVGSRISLDFFVTQMMTITSGGSGDER